MLTENRLHLELERQVLMAHWPEEEWRLEYRFLALELEQPAHLLVLERLEHLV